MSNFNIRILSSDDIKSVVSMSNAIEVMNEAFINLSSGKSKVPQRIHLDHPELNSMTLFMPVSDIEKKLAAVKVVSIANDNPKKGLPLINGLVTLYDASTGIPLAVMDGAYLTALRTGAASGLATDLLARGDAKTAAIFGAGVQGQAQLDAICAVRNIETAYIFDLNKENAARFINNKQNLNIDIIIGEHLSQLTEADIISTATNSSLPVFEHENLKEGVHINAVGSYQLKMREIPTETVRAAKVFVDQKESCLTEAGEFFSSVEPGKNAEDLIYGEIGQLASGQIPGRNDEKEITMFKSVGNAVQDLFAASLAYEKAEKSDIGQIVKI